MKVSANWLQDFIKLSPPLEKTAENLTLAGLEVNALTPVPELKDSLLEVEVTTNRPDWLSHLGVAREIAAVENLSLKLPDIETAKNRPPAAGWKLQVKEAEGCPYYSGVLIEGITAYETPDFIRDRLAACGIRTIHIIVDITNYVLLEVGQPLHAFDADLVQGREIRVRRAKDNEKMTAIDGSELTLTKDDLVIADENRAVALAGVMGGRDTEVNEKTRNVFLESAYFHPRWIRQSARRHGLSTDSSYRFERRVDPENADFGRERALWLIKRYAKPRFISTVLKAGQKPLPAVKTIHLSGEEIEACLGVSLKPHQITSILTRLGLGVSALSGDKWKVTLPSFRSDLERPVDLIEEIARIYGFDKIPEHLPERAPLAIQDSPLFELEGEIRNFLTGAGFFETVTFSLISDKGLSREKELARAVSIVNPQNKELCWMRPVLFSSLLNVVRKNFDWSMKDVFIYEVAHTYRQAEKSKGAEEEQTLGVMLCGNWQTKTWLDAERPATFYDLKGVVEALLSKIGSVNIEFVSEDAPGFLKRESAKTVIVNGLPAGFMGEIEPAITGLWDIDVPVFTAQFSLPKLLTGRRTTRPLEDLPKFPAVKRDFSLVVQESVKAEEIEAMIYSLKPDLIQKVEVFDLFRGGRIPQGHKSLGFRVTYQSPEKTLLSAEIQELHTSIADRIVKKFAATFQS